MNILWRSIQLIPDVAFAYGILMELSTVINSRDIELLEEIVNGIVIRLMGRMSAITEYEETSTDGLDVQLYIQHLMRKLGAIAFVGQHAMLLISQKISAVADSMLFMDPFDYAFPSLHDSIFLIMGEISSASPKGLRIARMQERALRNIHWARDWGVVEAGGPTCISR
ncbi:hypothetical protein AXF42_Ash001872 [Apostasia shenzhenica]|uniref:Uncharacterized protein n=1 Tax=Apostasia shenzhenica TaxID=1088818 RepID=A0A2I0ABG4_9ASPA|nr:hypothetical protein AXF42_Ash001872 [Apostasia shenzhenica]